MDIYIFVLLFLLGPKVKYQSLKRHEVKILAIIPPLITFESCFQFMSVVRAVKIGLVREVGPIQSLK